MCKCVLIQMVSNRYSLAIAYIGCGPYKTADDGGKTPDSEFEFDKTPRLQVSPALSLLPSWFSNWFLNFPSLHIALDNHIHT